MFSEKIVLITGGTGSFGKQFIKTILEKYSPKKIIVYSRDELKQFEMQQVFNQECMRYFIGDVRDGSRLKQAMRGVGLCSACSGAETGSGSGIQPDGMHQDQCGWR